jgi:hypothetical protein
MSLPPEALSGVEFDVAIAARTSVPVLISAAPEDAMRVASAIAGAYHGGAAMQVVAAADLGRLATAATADARRRLFRTIVIRDIDSIDLGQQKRLGVMLSRLRRKGAFRKWRLIATTSVPLYERVAAGTFDARLFYNLNVIHIVV